MPRAIKQLSNTEIGRIRSNLSSQASNIGARLRKHALGTLEDKDGNKIEMSSTQIKAAELILKHVLPGQASTTFEDITQPDKTKEQIESEYQSALEDIPKEQLQALLESKEERTQ